MTASDPGTVYIGLPDARVDRITVITVKKLTAARGVWVVRWGAGAAGAEAGPMDSIGVRLMGLGRGWFMGLGYTAELGVGL